MNMIILFVDDVRNPDIKMLPSDILIVSRDYENTIKLLDENEFDVVFLDHDLGEEKTGYDVITYLEEKIFTNQWNKKIPQIICHSANPVGYAKISSVIKKIAKKRIEELIN